MTGDAYLNAIRDLVARNQVYPELARPLGLSGTTVFQIDIDRSGNLLHLAVLQSSGTQVIDQALATAIRRSTPFPPVSADVPGRIVHIIARLYLPAP